jgi:hypothetical protein
MRVRGIVMKRLIVVRVCIGKGRGHGVYRRKEFPATRVGQERATIWARLTAGGKKDLRR